MPQTPREPPDQTSIAVDEPSNDASGNGAPTARQIAERRRAEHRRQRQLKRDRREEVRRNKPRMKKLRAAFMFSGLSMLAIVSWVFGVMMAVAQDLPDLELEAQYERAQNSHVFDREGRPLGMMMGNQRRILVESDEIALLVKQAVVAVEDERFYEHRGIDYLAIARALREDIIARSAAQGGSTITQQFVKNALEAQASRTILQKLREAALAYQIERNWTKDKILTNYLNNIYFGEGAYGIEAAARTFFGAEHGCGSEEHDRCASQLRAEEAALLAGMIASPSAYSPIANPAAALAQRNLVLDKMSEQGMLGTSEAELAELKRTPLPTPSAVEPPTEESEAPYFTDWLRQQVVDRYGAGLAFGGGLQITTTLDLELQRAAESAVQARVGGLGPTAAVVVLDNDTAEVLAMVAGEDFERAPFNLATNGRRQPGSAFKPFTLVAALEAGIEPGSIWESRQIDIPFEARVRKNGRVRKVNEIFAVNNYADSYLGSATLTTATTYSDNAVYAQVGMDERVGPEKVAETAREMGIASRVPTNPAMLLGGMRRGVTPLEMAYAYTTLANRGERVSGTLGSRGGSGPVGIREVKAGGDLIKDDSGERGRNKPTTEGVLPEGVADQAVDMLRTVVSSGTGTNAAIGLVEVWGKTGTTDNNADAWFVGATDEITVAVWIGHADGAIPMQTEFGGSPVDGGTIPALLWRDIVAAYQRLRPPEEGEGTAVPAADPAPVAPPEPAPEVTQEPVPAEAEAQPDPTPARPREGGGGQGGAPPAAEAPSGGGGGGDGPGPQE